MHTKMHSPHNVPMVKVLELPSDRMTDATVSPAVSTSPNANLTNFQSLANPKHLTLSPKPQALKLKLA